MKSAGNDYAIFNAQEYFNLVPTQGIVSTSPVRRINAHTVITRTGSVTKNYVTVQIG